MNVCVTQQELQTEFQTRGLLDDKSEWVSDEKINNLTIIKQNGQLVIEGFDGFPCNMSLHECADTPHEFTELDTFRTAKQVVDEIVRYSSGSKLREMHIHGNFLYYNRA